MTTKRKSRPPDPPPPHIPGHPSLTIALVERVLAKLSSSRSGIVALLKAEGSNFTTWSQACDHHPPLVEQYARAKTAQAHFLFAQHLDVSSDQTRDPACRRVEADSIKWVAAHLAPKVFGEKAEVEHTVRIADLPDDELERLIAVELAKTRAR